MTYRDDLGALRQRLDNLEQERGTLLERKRELEGATARLSDLEGELSEAREQEKKRRLPTLDNVRIAAPCPAKWEDMVGDERVRFCGQCTKNVYNVINLTKQEAEDLIRDKNGDVCMRLYQRKDGTILTADCPTGVKKRRRRRAFAGAMLSAAAGVLGYGGIATTVQGEIGYTDVQGLEPIIGDHDDVTVYAGGIEAIPEPSATPSAQGEAPPPVDEPTPTQPEAAPRNAIEGTSNGPR